MSSSDSIETDEAGTEVETAEQPNGSATGEREIVPGELDPWIGQVLGERYRVLELLGQGGMGTVYVAEHLTLHKQVALKLVHEAEGGEAHAQRFVREAMVTSLIDHPNVISAIDFGTFENGTAYLAMQLVRGPTLSQVLKDVGCMRWVRAANIGAQVADALCAAQAQGIVHRDLKPENVILQPLPDGTELVKLLDFGIAKHARDSLAPPPMQSTQAVTRVGVIIGTLGYMAPEQAVGKRADHRSDLYALGVMLWECVVGRRLWDTDDVQALLAEQLNRPARSVREASGDASIPDGFDNVVARLLAINPEQRAQSPASVRDALRELCAEVERGKLRSDEPSLLRKAPALLKAQAEPRVEQATRVERGPRERRPDLDVRLPPPPRAPATLIHSDLPPMPKPPAVPADMAPPPVALPPPPLVVPPPAVGALAPAAPLPVSMPKPPSAAASPPPTPPPRHSIPVRLRKRHLVPLGLVMLAIGAGAWFARGALMPSPPPPAPVAKPVVTKPVASEPQLTDEVRALMKSLVTGASREERAGAAEAILLHVPVDEIPAYGRAMAHLQQAETCVQKKAELEKIALVDDPRTLPVLITLAERRRSGCGRDGKDDCLGCLRDQLEALIKRLETRQMTPKP